MELNKTIHSIHITLVEKSGICMCYIHLHTICRLMEVLRDQAGGINTYLPDVMTISMISTRDKTTRHATAIDPEVNTFHRALASIAVLAQCFGLLPVYGVTAPSAQSLR
jgi:hypothetical protein